MVRRTWRQVKDWVPLILWFLILPGILVAVVLIPDPKPKPPLSIRANAACTAHKGVRQINSHAHVAVCMDGWVKAIPNK